MARPKNAELRGAPQIELDPDLGGQDYPEAFAQFLEAYAEDDRPYYVQVFECTRNDKSHAYERSYVKAFHQCIPTFDEIAALGPGKYHLLLGYHHNSGKRGSKGVTINISSKYRPDNMAGSKALSVIGNEVEPVSPDKSVVGQVVQMQSNFTTQLMQVMGLFMETISGVVTKREEMEAKFNNFNSITRIFNEMMISNVEAQQDMVQKIMSQRLDLPDNEPEQNERPNTFFDLLKEVFYRYGDQILGAAPQVQKFFKNQVQSSPEFEMISERPGEYKAACEDLIRENPQNKGKLEKLLTILGAPDPDLLIQAIEDQEKATTEK